MEPIPTDESQGPELKTLTLSCGKHFFPIMGTKGWTDEQEIARWHERANQGMCAFPKTDPRFKLDCPFGPETHI